MFKTIVFTVLLATVLLVGCALPMPPGTGSQPTASPTPTMLVILPSLTPFMPATATSTPVVVTPAATAETFNYVPGGPNYAWPQTGAEDVGNGWTRIRQAANGQFLTWNFLVRIACDREIGDHLQWDSSTRLNIYGPINCKVEIKRDLESSKTINPDPYNVANAKNSPLGLGWFIYGQGDITVNGSAMTLNGPGVKQMAFPKDWTGTWVITANVPANGLVVLLQGEKITTPDTWPLP